MYKTNTLWLLVNFKLTSCFSPKWDIFKLYCTRKLFHIFFFLFSFFLPLTVGTHYVACIASVCGQPKRINATLSAVSFFSLAVKSEDTVYEIACCEISSKWRDSAFKKKKKKIWALLKSKNTWIIAMQCKKNW